MIRYGKKVSYGTFKTYNEQKKGIIVLTKAPNGWKEAEDIHAYDDGFRDRGGTVAECEDGGAGPGGAFHNDEDA